jgi:thiol-disulfide isomerase/thioredoxin
MITLRTATFAVFGCLVASAALLADDLQQNQEWKNSAPRFILEIDALQNESEEKLKPAHERFVKANRAAKTEAERKAAHEAFIADFYAVMSPAVQKAFELVQPHATEPASVGPLLWIVRQCPADEETKSVQAALGLVVKYHLTNQRTLDSAYSNKHSGKRWVERILRAQLAAPELPEGSKPKQMLALATCLQRSAEMDRLDAGKKEAEAIKIFTELGEKYPNKELAPGLTFAAICKWAVFAINNLGVGKTAPDIESEDLNGVTFKLSDYRGKVVLLSFWASWCGPCMELLPHECELSVHYKGRPFAIVGVNSDPDRGELKPILEKHRIAWRSFWCGEKGPFANIPATWNVQAWPTVFLIDANGVIQAKNLLGTALDAKIEDLVAQAERPASKD